MSSVFLKSFTPVYLAVILTFGLITQVSADTIAFIGTGNVSSALGPKFADLGHDIIYG